MSLFPTNLWEIENTESVIKDGVQDYQTLSNAIDDFEFQSLFSFRYECSSKESILEKPDRIKAKSKSKSSQYQNVGNDITTEANIGNDASHITPSQYHTTEYHKFIEQTLTCDYIASTILNIVLKLTAEENVSSIAKTSATVQALWFAISQCHTIENNLPFQSQNHELLKRKMLIIIYTSLNKICSSGKKLDELVDTGQLISRFFDALQDDCYKDSVIRRKISKITHKKIEVYMDIKVENMKALVYCILLITQQILLKRKDENNLYKNLFNVFQSRVNTMTKALAILARHQTQSKSDLVEKSLHAIFKLIYILNSLSVDQAKLKMTRKSKKAKAVQLVTATHHESLIAFRCLLEMILLHTAQNVDAKKLRVIFVFFQRHTICCCNINLDIVYRILVNSLKHNMHKIALHFIKLNVLRTIYNNELRCGRCDTDKFIFKFKDEFVNLYKNWFAQLKTSEEIIVFLKHIAKISKYPQVNYNNYY